MTKLWVVDCIYDPLQPSIQEAGQLLREGKRVAFPTETVYGLGADAGNTAAVEGIFQAKGRPSDNPLIVHIAEFSQLDGLIDRLDEASSRLIAAFWPGPLTLVLPVKAGAVSPKVTAGLSTVAIRMPDHPIARSLIAAAGCPIAAPSANRSGRPSPTTADHVREDLEGKIEAIIDGGATGVGVESTVVEVIEGTVHLLRPGGVSAEQLMNVVGKVVWEEAGADWQDTKGPKSPGMKYTHYAPQGNLTIVTGDSTAEVMQWIQTEIDAAQMRGERTGVLTCSEHAAYYRADAVIACGRLAQPESIAHGLYGALRQFDREYISYLWAEAVDETGIGLAVMNRLSKAAGHQIIRI